jgi:hypothetical protein
MITKKGCGITMIKKVLENLISHEKGKMKIIQRMVKKRIIKKVKFYKR